MDNLVAQILANADYFLLMMFRVSGLVFPSPIFGRINIPAAAKISICLALTTLLFIHRPDYMPIAYNSLITFAFLCLGELLLGVCLAFITNLFFAVTFIAGNLIDFKIGFGIVNVFDAQNNTQIPMIGNVLNLILLIVFFGVNAHHRLLNIVAVTLDALPLGNLTFNGNIGLVALELFMLCFVLGVMVALPILVAGLVLEICFGVMVRSVPQINVFVVGIPIKLMVGMMLLVIVLPAFMGFSEIIFTEMFIGVEKMFATFITAP